MIQIAMLTKSEQHVIDCCQKGVYADFENLYPLIEHKIDNSTIRAEVIVAILLDEMGLKLHPKGVRIKGAKIIGQIDFEYTTLKFPLHLINCTIEQEIKCSDAIVEALRFSGTSIKGFIAERLVVKKSLYIDNNFVCNGSFILRDARIEGGINAIGSTFQNPEKECFNGVRMQVSGACVMSKCSFDGLLTIAGAKINGSFSLSNSKLSNPSKICFDGSLLSVEGSIAMNEGFKSLGEIKLNWAQVKGTLHFGSAHISNRNGITLNAFSINIGGEVQMVKDFKSEGKIVFNYSRIGSRLVCTDNAIFNNPDNTSFEAYELRTGSTILFSRNCMINGNVILIGSNIGGAVVFQGHFSNPEKTAINIKGVVVKFDLEVNKNTIIAGLLQMDGCEIGGSVRLQEIQIENVGHNALDARLSQIKGDVIIGTGCRFLGQVIFSKAKIGANFQANGSKFDAHPNTSLTVDNTSIGNNLLLRSIETKGQLVLQNARVGGDIDFAEAKIENGQNGISLHAVGLSVNGTVYLTPKFTSIGHINFMKTVIGGDLSCRGATFKNFDRNNKTRQHNFYIFSGNMINVKGSLIWDQMPIIPEGKVTFINSKIGILADDLQSWPHRGDLHIQNMEYSLFALPTLEVNHRLEWIRKNNQYMFQPYDQTIKVLRQMGFSKDSRIIARSKLNDLRKFGTLGKIDRFFNYFLDFSIGHGYQLWRLGIAALFFIFLGTIIFSKANSVGAMLCIKDGVKDKNILVANTLPNKKAIEESASDTIQKCPAFSAFIYSLDVFLPIVNMRQKDNWLPIKKEKYSNQFMIYVWIQTLMGWLLTTLGVAGLTGVVKKE